MLAGSNIIENTKVQIQCAIEDLILASQTFSAGTGDGRKNRKYFFENVQDQIFTGFWHNLYIRRLPGRSHRFLPGFYPSYRRDFKVSEGKTYQKPTRTNKNI